MAELAETSIQKLFAVLREDYPDVHFVSVGTDNAVSAVIRAKRTKKSHYVVTRKGVSGGKGANVTKTVYTNMPRKSLLFMLKQVGINSSPGSGRTIEGVIEQVLEFPIPTVA